MIARRQVAHLAAGQVIVEHVASPVVAPVVPVADEEPVEDPRRGLPGRAFRVFGPVLVHGMDIGIDQRREQEMASVCRHLESGHVHGQVHHGLRFPPLLERQAPDLGLLAPRREEVEKLPVRRKTGMGCGGPGAGQAPGLASGQRHRKDRGLPLVLFHVVPGHDVDHGLAVRRDLRIRHPSHGPEILHGHGFLLHVLRRGRGRCQDRGQTGQDHQTGRAISVHVRLLTGRASSAFALCASARYARSPQRSAFSSYCVSGHLVIVVRLAYPNVQKRL